MTKRAKYTRSRTTRARAHSHGVTTIHHLKFRSICPFISTLPSFFPRYRFRRAKAAHFSAEIEMQINWRARACPRHREICLPRATATEGEKNCNARLSGLCTFRFHRVVIEPVAHNDIERCELMPILSRAAEQKSQEVHCVSFRADIACGLFIEICVPDWMFAICFKVSLCISLFGLG